jgi:serine/threonine protein kinase/Flp pilus assembly protein TadD
VLALIVAHRQFADHPDLYLPPPSDWWPGAGECVGDFTLLRELGQGTFGRVFLATEGSTGDRPVVIKLSRRPSPEARTLGPLAHDHIVPILSARHDIRSDLHVVCMPFLGSSTLEDVLTRIYPCPRPSGRPPIPRRAAVILEAVRATGRPNDPPPDSRFQGSRPEVARLLRASFVEGVARLGLHLAEALVFLHGKECYHRDLKPSNVLLTPNGWPVLLDFNLAFGSLATSATPSARLGGTLHYMAPEQLRAFLAGRNDPGVCLARADLFSLGVILYELLTGTHPFDPALSEGRRDQEELARILLLRHTEGFTPLRQRNPAVGRTLAHSIERCLSANPADRPASAAEFASALGRAISGRLRRRRPGLAGVSSLTLQVGVCLLLCCAAVWLLLRSTRTRTEPAASTSSGAQIEELLDDARRLAREEKYAEAEKMLARAIQEDPHCYSALHNLGQLQLVRGQRAKARGEADRADNWFRQAQEHFAGAIEAGKKRRGGTHGRWQDYYGLGRVQIARGDFAMALTYLDRAEKQQRAKRPRHDIVLTGDLVAAVSSPWTRLGSLAVSRLRTKDHGRTLACLSYSFACTGRPNLAGDNGLEALAAGFCGPAVHNNLGLSYLRQNLPDKARFHLDEAIRQNPGLLAGYCNRANLALIRYSQSKGRAAEQLFSQALADLDRGIALARHAGPECPVLSTEAARLCCVSLINGSLPVRSPIRQERLKLASHYLTGAAGAGANLTALKQDRTFRETLPRDQNGCTLLDHLAQCPIRQRVHPLLVDPVTDQID